MKAAAVAALLGLALLAGCSSSPSKAADPLPGVDELKLEATPTTGVIRGVVVDEAIRPVAGATVTLQGASGQATNSTEQGAFGFDGLEAGTYFLHIEKAGYFPVQQSADVEAGVAEPPVVKVLLARQVGYLPHVDARSYDGYVECTTSFVVLCGAPNLLLGQNLTNDRYTWTWFFAPNGTLMQAEMAWESSQSLTPTLYFEMEPDGDCDEGFYNNTEGTSPIVATLGAADFRDGPLNDSCGVYFSLFSGHNEPLPRWPVTGWGWGATVEQRFTMFTHAFYDFVPPPGWRFTSDGAPEVPA